jgi:hypothetical protein
LKNDFLASFDVYLEEIDAGQFIFGQKIAHGHRGNVAIGMLFDLKSIWTNIE